MANKRLINRLRKAADALDQERAILRHRLVIDNAASSHIASAVGDMREVADNLEKL